MHPATAATWEIKRAIRLDLDDGRLARLHLKRRAQHLARLADSVSAQAPEPPPFVIVTPLGVMRKRMLAIRLGMLGIGVTHVTPIEPWPMLSTALYLRGYDHDRLRIALAFERLWSDLYPHIGAECWQLGEAGALTRMRAARHVLRAEIASLTLFVTTRDHEFSATLPALHVPEPEQAGLDAARVNVVARHGASLRTDCAATIRRPLRSLLSLARRS